MAYHQIKFSYCPVGKHKGEVWDKLAKVDLKEPVKLVRTCVYMRFDPTCGVDHGMVREPDLETIRADTFSDAHRNKRLAKKPKRCQCHAEPHGEAYQGNRRTRRLC